MAPFTGRADHLRPHRSRRFASAFGKSAAVEPLEARAMLDASAPISAAAAPVPLVGHLNPSSDTGASHTDGITSITTPNFVGTTTPGATVQLFSVAQGNGFVFPLGQTTAGATGAWSITSRPLVDGSYGIVAVASAPGLASSTNVIIPGSGAQLLVIDTVAPDVTFAAFDQAIGLVTISLQDQGAGLDPATLSNPSNYSLVHQHRNHQAPITGIRVEQTGPDGTVNAVLTINRAHPLPNGRFTLAAFGSGPGAIADLAGNPLSGAFDGTFPTGVNNPGTDFVTEFTAFKIAVNPPAPVIGTFGPAATSVQAGGAAHRRHSH